MRRELVCLAPSDPPRLQVRLRDKPRPGKGEVLVRVGASSVNPIDAKRAAGYGRRLLGVKGAADFPCVLGNDVAGFVEALGPGAEDFGLGDRVFGLVATGARGGAHTSHVVLPQRQLLRAPAGIELEALAVIPYCFTTMFLAVRSTGLAPSNAPGRRVLVNGASGGLGQLALQMLAGWQSHVTAVCSDRHHATCLALGAQEVITRGRSGHIEVLPAEFDVVLNFGDWSDDHALATRLAPRALGHATTVHPLMANFDNEGWMNGLRSSLRQWRAMRAVVRGRSPRAAYVWTTFKPDRQALDALGAHLQRRRCSLPTGITCSLEDAAEAFEHVSGGRPGRAVLLPRR